MINSNIIPTIRLALGALLFVTLAACGDKFVNGSSGATANFVTVSGVVSITALKPVLKPAAQGGGHRHAAMGGGKVEALDSKGNSLVSAAIGADGSFSLQMATGSNYLLRATKGNVCLKAYVEKADSAQFVPVDPTSSATVKVLGKKIGDDLLGEPGHDFSTSVSGVDMPAILAAIRNNGQFTTVAQAIADDIAAHADYAAVTVSVGVVSTAGDTEANGIAITIVIVITINGQQANAPAAPAGVSATAGDGVATVSWSAVSGAETYNLYYSGTPGVAGIAVSGITGTTYTLTGLTNGSAYYFTVTAARSGAESAGSAQIRATPQITVPAAPSALSASGQNGSIILSWPLVDKAVSYDLYWSVTPGVTVANGTKIADITGTSYTHTGLTNGTAYHYILVGGNAGGQSAASAELSFELHGWKTLSAKWMGASPLSLMELNGVAYFVGARDAAGTALPSVHAYDPVSDSWSDKAPMNVARGFSSLAALNGQLYAIGGADVHSAGLATNEAYDPASDMWTLKAAMPTPRQSPSVATLNGKIYAMAGGGSKAVEVYDPAANLWTALAPAGAWDDPSADHAVVVTLNNVFYFIADIGGMTIIAYDPVANSITQSPRAAASAGSLPAFFDGLIAVNNAIYMIAPVTTATVYQFDPGANDWIDTSLMPTAARSNTVDIVFNNGIWVIGGYLLSGASVESVEVEFYDPAAKIWSAKPPLPEGSVAAFAAVINNQMYVFSSDGISVTPLLYQ